MIVLLHQMEYINIMVKQTAMSDSMKNERLVEMANRLVDELVRQNMSAPLVDSTEKKCEKSCTDDCTSAFRRVY